MKDIATNNQLSSAYLDVRATVAKIKSSIPAQELKEIEASLDSLPLESLGWSHRMDRGLADSIAIQLVPHDETQKQIIALLAGNNAQESLTAVPHDAIFSLSLDGTTLVKIKNFALTQMDQATADMARQQLASLDALRSLAVAVRGTNQMSPFPELLLVGSGSSASAVSASFKAIVNEAVGASGIQLGDWQSKVVDGSKVDFLMSPLGIGAFQTEMGNSVALGTSEGAVIDATKAGKDAAASLKGSMKGSSAELFDSGSMIFVYANFERMTELLQSVQGSLAMFTGGNTSMPEEAIEQLRKLGVFSATVAYSNDLLKVESRYDSVPAK
jgi:hypothetical protein